MVQLTIDAVISNVSLLPLREVAKAHQRLEEGGVRGKIVLQVEEGVT